MDIILILSALSIILIFFGRFLNIYSTKKLIILSYIFCLFLLNLKSNVVSTTLFFFFTFDLNLQIIQNSFRQRMRNIVLRLTFIIFFFIFKYLKNDPFFILFCGYFCFFSLRMLLIVFRNTILLFFIAWEFVGLASFLLISFWTTRRQRVKRGIKAFRLNKFGDFALLIRRVLIYRNYNTLNLTELSLIRPFIKHDGILYRICFLLVICVLAKSAQVGFQAWLRDAMEGPTPVSALLHAATMVTAGIVLIFRFSFFFILLPFINLIFILAGVRTIFLSIFLASEQIDLKKLIAFSTCNQIGYMLYLSGLMYYETRFFHLRNHAFIKATLFLIAGRIIASSYNEQDIRFLSRKNFVFLKLRLFGRSISLLGGFFFTGFFSKELFFQIQNCNLKINNFRLFIFILTSLFFGTIIYLNNILKLLKNNNFLKLNFKESSDYLILIRILLFFCISFGFFFKNFFIFENKYFLADSLYFYDNFKILDFNGIRLSCCYFILLYTFFITGSTYFSSLKKWFYYFNDFCTNLFFFNKIKKITRTSRTYYFLYRIPKISTNFIYQCSIYCQDIKTRKASYFGVLLFFCIMLSILLSR